MLVNVAELYIQYILYGNWRTLSTRHVQNGTLTTRTARSGVRPAPITPSATVGLCIAHILKGARNVGLSIQAVFF